MVDMKKLTQLAEGAIKKEGYEDLLDRIYAGRLAKTVIIDIEVILSVLDYLSEPSVDKIGPAGEFLNLNLEEIMSKSNYPNRREYRKIRRRIEQIIVKSCMSCNFDSANQYYRKLFQFDVRNLTKYVNSKGQCCGPLQICSHAATTNYDLILERYDHDNIEPNIHFLKRGFHRNGYEWNQPTFESPKAGEVVYLKLHGSIDWWLRESDNAIVSNDNSHTLLGEIYKERKMIYPIYGKPDTLEPYVSLYEDFRKFLRSDNIYVCVGYSFRDKAINAAFSNSLKKMSSKRLVIINTKKSKKIIRNNTKDFPHDQLDYIEIPFGSDRLFEELESVLTQRARGI